MSFELQNSPEIRGYHDPCFSNTGALLIAFFLKIFFLITENVTIKVTIILLKITNIVTISNPKHCWEARSGRYSWMIENWWDSVSENRNQGQHNSKHSKVKTAAEGRVRGRSPEPESTGAGGHVWSRRKQQVRLWRTAEGSGIGIQVKARTMSTETKEAGYCSK